MSQSPFRQIEDDENTVIEELLEQFTIDEILRHQTRQMAQLIDAVDELNQQQQGLGVDGSINIIEGEGGGGFIHAFDKNVDLADEDVDHEFTIPGVPNEVTVHVDGASAGFEVIIEFLTDTFGDLTTRDQSDSSVYTGDSTTDVYINSEAASPFVRITLSDTAASSSNTVDYTIIGR